MGPPSGTDGGSRRGNRCLPAWSILALNFRSRKVANKFTAQARPSLSMTARIQKLLRNCWICWNASRRLRQRFSSLDVSPTNTRSYSAEVAQRGHLVGNHFLSIVFWVQRARISPGFSSGATTQSSTAKRRPETSGERSRGCSGTSASLHRWKFLARCPRAAPRKDWGGSGCDCPRCARAAQPQRSSSGHSLAKRPMTSFLVPCSWKRSNRSNSSGVIFGFGPSSKVMAQLRGEFVRHLTGPKSSEREWTAP